MDVVPEFVVEEAARRFVLLGDPTRLRVVSAVHRRGEACVSDLASDCDTSGWTGAFASGQPPRDPEGGNIPDTSFTSTRRLSAIGPRSPRLPSSSQGGSRWPKPRR